MMGTLGFGCSLIAVAMAVASSLGLVDWVDWVTTIPVALVGVISSAIGLSSDEKSGLTSIGFLLGMLVIFWALSRWVVASGIL